MGGAVLKQLIIYMVTFAKISYKGELAPLKTPSGVSRVCLTIETGNIKIRLEIRETREERVQE